MPDKKEIVLQKCKNAIDHGEPITDYSFYYEVIELLKEQEPVKAVADGEDSYVCDTCGTVIGWDAYEPGGFEELKYKLCPKCGRPVKWEW